MKNENAAPLVPDSYVLVADDDPLVLKSIRFVLQKAGFRLCCVTDGDQALKQARAVRPAVILLDVMMPTMDGLEACRTLKADPDLQMVPVFLVTARAMEPERQRGLDAGADEYVTKPFVNAELVELVRAVIDPSQV